MTAAGRGDSSSLSRIRRLAGPGLSPPSARLVASPRHVVDEPEPLAGLRAGPSLCSDLAKIWIFGDFRPSLSGCDVVGVRTAARQLAAGPLGYCRAVAAFAA